MKEFPGALNNSVKIKSKYNKEDIHTLDDNKLVELAKEGNRKAFELLMKRYERKVFGIAYGMLYDVEEAREIVQEAFIKVFRYIMNFHGEASFYTWLYRITVNLSIDRLRKLKKTSQNHSYDDRLKIKGDKKNNLSEAVIEAQNQNPETLTIEKEKIIKLREAMNKLPAHHRSVIILREVEELSYQEIADTLGISIGTVMSRLHHARKKLIEMLKEER